MSLQFFEVDKAYGRAHILKRITFSVRRGEIVGLLGPNGSGKTTTMRLAAGSIYPDAGSITVFDEGATQSAFDIRERIGYLPERPPLYDALNVHDYLSFVAEVKKISLPTRAVDKVVDSCALDHVIGTRIGRLSKGFRQRVGLAQALIGKPALLLLDEPTSGLDPLQVREARKLITRDAVNRITLLSTHVVEEAAAMCTRLLLIRDGGIVSEYKVRNDEGVVIQKVRLRHANPLEVRRVLLSLEGVEKLETEWEENEVLLVKCFIRKGFDIRERISKILVASWDLLELSPARESLEDHIVEIYGDGTREMLK